MDFTEQLKTIITEQFPADAVTFSEFSGEVSVTVNRNSYIQLCTFLKHDERLRFLLLEDLSAIDWATRKNRFDVVIHLFSLQNNFRLVVICTVDDKDYTIDSVCSVWQAANWAERETYDMYGITFKQHPDMRRMYMPEEFEYHPLRKEFPLMGIPGSIPLPKKP